MKVKCGKFDKVSFYGGRMVNGESSLFFIQPTIGLFHIYML